MCAGVIFGWSEIVLIFRDEGQYQELCSQQTDSASGASNLCSAQELRLNLAFTLASAFACVMSACWGVCFDHYGPRCTHLWSCAMVCVGALLMALFQSRSFDSLIPGMMLLGGGGPGVYLAHVNIAQTSKHHAGGIIGLISGAFDGSAVVGLILRELTHSIGRRSAFFGYAGLLALFCINSIMVPAVAAEKAQREAEDASPGTPADHTNADHKASPVAALIVTPCLAEDTTEEDACAASTDPQSQSKVIFHMWEHSCSRSEQSQTQETFAMDITGKEHVDDAPAATVTAVPMIAAAVAVPTTGSSAVPAVAPVPLSAAPFRVQVRSWLYFLGVFMFSISILRLNFFFGTVTTQLTVFDGSAGDGLSSTDQTLRMTRIFNVIVGVSVCLAPVVGKLLDWKGMPTAFTVTQVVMAVFGVCILIPSLPLQYFSFCLFAVSRAWFYVCSFSFFVGCFGGLHIGKLYGLASLIAGAVSTLQYALFALAFAPNPPSFLVPNLLLLAGGIICIAIMRPVTIAHREANGTHKKQAAVAQEATKQAPGSHVELE